jgi:DNA-directed RNA polymerase specialized sigma24 family protein
MPPASSDTTATLVEGQAAGHAAGGLTAGFPALYRDLVRFIARRTGNEDDARDLAHLAAAGPA